MNVFDMEPCLHGNQHFMSIGCFSHTVVMVTFMPYFRKIIAYLIEKICYYSSCMNYPSLKDSKKL